MFTPIPTQFVGPIFIKAETWESDEIQVPLATYETTLWPSTQRGAKISRLCDGIQVTTLKNCMTRSVYFSTASARRAKEILSQIHLAALQQTVAQTSAFAQLQSMHPEIIGTQLYLRFSFVSGDASGHNMTTKASDALIEQLLQQFPDLQYGSISANLCVDKKVSSINGILGRGKHVTAEIIIPRALCSKHLRTTPELMQQLNVHKNLMGGILAGGVRSANAHYANILLATYLATGQDAANIVEGSQGITTAEITREGDLYFSVNLPNLIVGTVGHGKHHSDISTHLKNLGCEPNPAHPGQSSQRLAEIIAATVLCGELSLMSAQTNRGELMKSHLLFERKK